MAVNGPPFACYLLDTEPPAVSGCPADARIPVNSSAQQAVFNWSPPSFSDNSGDVNVTFECTAATPSDCDLAGRGSFSAGVTTVTYTARDASGNAATCSFDVTVTGGFEPYGF